MSKITKEIFRCPPYSVLTWQCERHNEIWTKQVTPDMSPYKVQMLIIKAYLQVNREMEEFILLNNLSHLTWYHQVYKELCERENHAETNIA